jgi:hypothetical protein
VPLFILLFVLISVINCSTVNGAGKNSLMMIDYHPQNYSDMRLLSLSEAEIKSAKVTWGPTFHRTLNIKEIHSLVNILRRVNKEDIESYIGPGPKGGPFQVTLYLKSKEQLTLTLNGYYILAEGNQIYQPEFSEFMNQFQKELSRLYR